MRALFLIAALALTGCASSPAVVAPPPIVLHQHLRDVVPQSLLHCLPEPDGAKVATVREVARHIVALKRAGRDCRDKLKSVGVLIEDEGQ
jgi:hypothetical protein